MTINLRIDHLTVQLLGSEDFQEIITRLTNIERKADKILMTDQQVSDLLDQVNTTTNAIAANQTTDAATLGTVKAELDALIATQGQPSGISDATAAKLQALATAVGGVQTNAKANSTVLTAIAAEGQPVVPPPPPTQPTV